MTRTRAANDAALPSDRRTFLGSSLALASALTAAALPAPADAETVSGPIEAAWPKHVALSRIADAATVALDDAEERYQEPPRPRWNPFVEGGYEMVRQPEGVRACLSLEDENLSYLRSLVEKPFVHVDDAPVELSYHMHERRVRKARKTLNEIEAWQAECRTRSEAVGLPEAQAASDQAMQVLLDHADAMFAIEPTNLRELAFQAALVDQHWIKGWDEMLVRRAMKLAGIVHYWDADEAAEAEGRADVA